MNKRITGLLIAVLLAAGLVVAISAAGGNGNPWAGAEPSVKLSPDDNVLAESNLVLGPDNRVAVIWSKATAPHAIWLAQTQGSGWSSATLASTGNQETWNPAVAYSGTKAIAAWAQGGQRTDRYTPHAVMQKDEGALTAQTIITPVFGNVEIGLVVAPTGMHMIFAATASTSPTIISKFPWDLYYTHRYLTETTWSPPTVVVTYAQVIPAEIWNTSMTAGIWEPRLAANADGTQFSLVWRQEHSSTPTATTYLTYTAWYASGSWQSGHMDWSSPQQVSPPEQKYTIRPNVAVGPTGNVYIVWTELIPGSGGLTRPDAQYINYRQLSGPAPIRISDTAIKVNAQQPTRAAASIAARGERLCVAWHGFYTGDKEEIILNCSLDEGASWQSLINVSESEDRLSFFPTIKLDAANQVHVAWTEYSLVGIDLVPNGLYYRTGTSDVKRVFLPLVMRRA